MYADDVLIIFLLDLFLGGGGYKDAGHVFKLGDGDGGQLCQRAAGRDLDAGRKLGEDHIDIFIGKGPALVIENKVGLTRMQHGIEILVIAVFNGDGNIRILFGELLYRMEKLSAGIAAQISDLQGGMRAAGYLSGFAAHPFIVGCEHKAFSVKIFSCGSQAEGTVFALDQLEAKLTFKGLYLLGYGRLRDIILFSGK